jgi:hypothetical protein
MDSALLTEQPISDAKHIPNRLGSAIGRTQRFYVLSSGSRLRGMRGWQLSVRLRVDVA